MIQVDELDFLTNNKSIADLSFQYEELCDKQTIFRESCRHFLSKHLVGHDEDNPLKVSITLDDPDAMGLSSLQMPHLTKIWQVVPEGYIVFEVDGAEWDFDTVADFELMQIVEVIDKLCESHYK